LELQNSINKRKLSNEQAKNLKAGDQHYTAYVGPPKQYDLIGAMQFRLLCTLGLRQHHKLLDMGCGSLRAGKLIIPYLDKECYHGIDPNKWLIDEAIDKELGADILSIKRPRFLYNDDFSCHEFGTKFDFIVAQSIFSHTGKDIIQKALLNFAQSLKPDGMACITFVHSNSKKDFEGTGWLYPDCAEYSKKTIQKLIHDSGLIGVEIPFYHPRQTWYVLGKSADKLPKKSDYKYLKGAVLFTPEFNESCKINTFSYIYNAIFSRTK